MNEAGLYAAQQPSGQYHYTTTNTAYVPQWHLLRLHLDVCTTSRPIHMSLAPMHATPTLTTCQRIAFSISDFERISATAAASNFSLYLTDAASIIHHTQAEAGLALLPPYRQ